MSDALHSFSGFTVKGVLRALETMALSEAVLSKLPEPAREAVERGSAFRFAPGPPVDALFLVVCADHGEDAAARVMELATQSNIEGVVAPLARMFLTFKKNDPIALFERFNDLLRIAVRGISAQWEGESAQSGTLTITYPTPIDARLVHPWRGAVRYVLAFCHREGTVTVAPGGPSSVSVRVEWK